MSPVVRTPPESFAEIAFARAHPVTVLDWPAPDLDDPLQLHVVDAPAVGTQRGTFVLLHGEPSWSHLYHQWIPRLTAAGYRCVAPDQPGFGRSDKPADAWYSYERHVAAVRFVIEELGLTDIRLVVQDWAGPIGLRQLVDRPELFSRAFIFNTWLHHAGYEYTDGVRMWHMLATDPDRLGGDMPTGRIVAGTLRREAHDREAIASIYDAPFDGPHSKAGARAFPAMLPFSRPEVGGAVVVARQHGRPIYFMTANFQVPEDGLEHQDPMPEVAPPEECLDFAELSRRRSRALSEEWEREWAALEVRWAGDSRPGGPLESPEHPARQRLWIKTNGVLPDDRLTHVAAFSYASDMTLLGATLVPHGFRVTEPRMQSASLDHSMWFHRPFPADQWWLYDQVSPSASGGRGLAIARVFTQSGELVASVAQEGLIRVRSDSSS